MKAFLQNVLRSFGVLAILTVLMFILFPMVSSATPWIAIPMSILFPALFLMISAMDGISQGEKDMGWTELLEKRTKEGYAPSDEENSRCFHAPRGFLAAAVAMAALYLILLLILSLIRWGTAQSTADAAMRYKTMNASMAAVRAVMPAGASGFLPPFSQLIGMAYTNPSPIDPFDMAARISQFAYSGFFEYLQNMGILTWCYPLMALLFPLAEGFGYLQGPKRRAAVHAAIEKGKKRARRKRKMEMKKKNG